MPPAYLKSPDAAAYLIVLWKGFVIAVLARNIPK